MKRVAASTGQLSPDTATTREAGVVYSLAADNVFFIALWACLEGRLGQLRAVFLDKSSSYFKIIRKCFNSRSRL